VRVITASFVAARSAGLSTARNMAQQGNAGSLATYNNELVACECMYNYASESV
jgi:hypothetical protein